ncbi:lipocalin family protein [Tenacibaculum geojense]|uniref:Lipocalin family protein n=1 Tax=Tenacibaculum geojense TaxID=915352 RepID=A0ABW3JR97_9FLAO
MKQVIKGLAIFLMLIVVTSCQDDNDTQQRDPLVGIWYPFSEDGVEESDCRKESTFTFSTDGTYRSIGIIDDTDGTCINDFDYNGTWENVGSNTYEFIASDNDNPDRIEFIFSDNNNTFTIGTSVYKRK